MDLKNYEKVYIRIIERSYYYKKAHHCVTYCGKQCIKIVRQMLAEEKLPTFIEINLHTLNAVIAALETHRPRYSL